MPIEVRLYGNLKLKASSTKNPAGFPAILKVDAGEVSEVSDVFQALGIGKDEASHVFVNGEYSGLGKDVKDGDRVAIFPKDMSLLYKWYFRRVE
ncbi:hypothetical protein AKJ48_00875 [candidate division MSBL1 archaeon SCGC-AAA261O19]|uniref:Ubiquitin Mut7-C domain-containing protein n=2 Tax=candidate division MSBL1 TaxID=215777 RepID=A0A133V1S9_9EURY|nr:hypothetical protein AKJ42_00925 [candidate division MSBL1 archaeon SCGC-AAA261C02]KXB04918.1 hypothetical protein AKJ48_00875 [candidate division MSBL1 archaeon SCGC-AAA261O19]